MDEAQPTTDAHPTDGGARAPARWWSRPFPWTDMPVWLMLVLVGLGLPRTVLADLGIVEPESGLLYYFLALTPFAAWLATAILRRTRRPVMDFLVLGLVYGLSLVVVHQLLWSVAPSSAHSALAGAIDFAERFDGGLYEVALRGYTVVIAMVIGVGTGAVAALVALGAHASRRARNR